MQRRQGFTTIELLVVIAIIGIISGAVMMNGRRILIKQQENASINAIQQILVQGATTATARNITVELHKQGNVLNIVNPTSNTIIAHRELSDSVTTNLSDGLIFTISPAGKIATSQLSTINPIEITTSGKTFEITVTVIGETKVVAQ